MDALFAWFPDPRALGEDIGFLRPPLEGLRDNFLRMAQTIGRRGVDPVDAQIQGASDGCN